MSLAPYSAAEFRRRAVAQTLTLGEESWREHGDLPVNARPLAHPILAAICGARWTSAIRR